MIKSKNNTEIQNGQVVIGEDGRQYFVFNKNYIEISEHFTRDGKSLGDLIEDVILYTIAHRTSA